MSDGNRWTNGGWRTPAGISSIAAVLGVLVAVVALFVSGGPDSPAAPTPTNTTSGTYVFVYGTTMPGHLRYPYIEAYVAEATPDSVDGRLYDTGQGYPAAVFGASTETIEGYVLRLRPDRAVEALRAFTEMEAGLFHPTKVTTQRGIEASAYEWLGPTDGLTPLRGKWSGKEA
jgi:gamma-glutamylcyclotransferase (GGCT)/AIG2-like uncharacterized protein YtfP